MYFQNKDIAPHDYKRVSHIMSMLHQEITTVIIMFFKACDLLIADLEDTFESQHISKVLSIKQALIQAANGDAFECEVAHLRESSYKHDINWSGLMLHLLMFQGIMKKDTFIMQVTSTSAVCDAMNTIIIIKIIV